MRVTIWDWAYEAKETLRALGYEHGQQIEDCNPFDVAENIFSAGLNVMVFHTPEDVVVAADTKRFGSRG